MDSDIISFISDILAVAGLMIVAWLAFMILVVRRLEARLTRELEQVSQEIETEKLIALTVEVAGDQFLCYNAQTMAFVCQGRDLDEIRQRFKQRYPSKNAAIYNGDESAVRTLKQQLKAMHEDSSGVRSTS